MLKQMLTTKSFDHISSEHKSSQLKRILGPWQLALLGVGCTIGTGIFVLTGQEAAIHAGPAIVISFIIAGIGSMLAGLCYAEFASMVPIAGSAYSYTFATMGEFAAWFIGWNLLLEYLFAAATVAVGWARYFVKILDHFDINFLPASLSAAPFATVGDSFSIVTTGAVLNFPAMFIAAIAATICYIGIKQSAWVNSVVVVLKVGVILAVIGFGAAYLSSANWHPFIPANTGTFGSFGWSGVIRASGVIFFAYIGFDAVSTAAQEARNPSRDLPFGLIMGLTICTVLYILMAATLTGLMPYKQLNDAAPVALAMESTPGLHWLSIWVIIGAIAGLTSVILVMILAQSRILLAMAQDGLLPAALGKVHERFRTPHVATVLTGAIAALMAGLFPLGLLSELVSIGTLIAFIMVCGGVLILRYRRPDIPRPFRVAWPWITCGAGVIFCAVMAWGLTRGTWIRLYAWTAIGIAVYFWYGRRHSKLRKD